MADQNSSSVSSPSAQANVQATVVNNPSMPECRRKLSAASFTANSTVSVDIPRDTAIKRINLFSSLGLTATYASGSPVLSPLGALARACVNYTIVADGSRNIKVIDLFMQRCMQALAYEGYGRRAYQTGASKLSSTSQPTTEWFSGTIAYGATTQDLIVQESVDVMFENYFAYEKGRNISFLYTKNLSTCSMYFGFGAIDNIINTGNAAPVVYTNVSMSITPTIIEARDAGPEYGAFDFVETVIRKQFSSQTTLFSVDLNTGNKLLGVGLLAQDGDTARSVSDTAVTDLNLLVNGSTSLQLTNLRQLMNDNKGRFGLGADDQFASGLHGQAGFAYMNLMKGGDILSGLDTRQAAGVSQVQLQVSTAASSGVDPATYTNPVQLSVWQQQLIPVPIKA